MAHIRLLTTQLLLFLLLFATSLQAQFEVPRPYDGEKDPHGLLLGLGGGLTTVSIMLDRRVSPLNDEDLTLLTIDRVFPIDRYSTRHLSPTLAHITDRLVLATVASPFLLLMDRNGRSNAGEAGLILFEGALINSGLVNLTKVLVQRPRPFLFNNQTPLEMKLEKNARYSFFSGHTSSAAYFAFATAQMYSDLYPDSNAKPYVWATAALIPVITGYGRMRAGRHYFTDVLVGLAIGATVGIVVPSLHR